MKLESLLQLSSVLPLTVGLIACIIVAVVPLFVAAPSWSDKTEAFLTEATVQATSTRVQSLISFVDSQFSSMSTQLQMFAQYSTAALNHDPEQFPPTATVYYRPWLGLNGLDGGLIAPLDGNGMGLHGQFYQPTVHDYTALNSFSHVNELTLTVNAMRPILTANPLFKALYIGTATKIFFSGPPRQAFDSYFTNTYQSSCTGSQMVGYDPTCRGWYTLAVSSNPGANNATAKVAFTSPYLDATTNTGLVSLAIPLYTPSAVVLGVASADVEMTEIDTAILNTKIIKDGTGYSILLDTSALNLVISHPSLNRASNPAPPIATLEPSILSNVWNTATAFVLANPRNLTSIETTKDNAVWKVTCGLVTAPKYMCCVLYPASEITKQSDKVSSDLNKNLIGAAIGIVCSLVVVLVILIFIMRAVSKHYTAPLADFTRVLTDLNKSDLNSELAYFSDEAKAPANAGDQNEMHNIGRQFKNLLVAVRFGNVAYGAGHLDKALANYKAAEELMVQYKNTRGLGVCYNNEANIYMAQGKLPEARALYEKSIALAQQRHDAPTATKAEQLAEKSTIANRMMNLGLLCRQQSIAAQNRPANMIGDRKSMGDQKSAANVSVDLNLAEARTTFEKSLQLFRNADDMVGVAKVSGNLSLLYIESGEWKHATGLLNDVAEIIGSAGGRDPNSQQFQFLAFNRAVLDMKTGETSRAIDQFAGILQQFPTLDANIRQGCLEHLASCYDAIVASSHHPGKAQRVDANAVATARHYAALLRQSGGQGAAGGAGGAAAIPRRIRFVLDVSGSMAGGFIRTCRESLISIFTDSLHANDSISLLTFSNRIEKIFNIRPRGELESDSFKKMCTDVETRTNAGGGTAFYEALNVTLNEAATAAAAGTKATPTTDLIISLTDGADNSSSVTPQQLIQLMESQKMSTGNKFNYALIVITVGSLENIAVIQSLVANGRGIILEAAAASDGIKVAFGKVAHVLQGQANFESL